MNRNFTVAMLSTLAISFVPSVYAASNYRVQPIMPEGAVETTITSLSDDGRAVGTLKRCSSSNKKSEDCYYRGFIASGGDNEVEV